MFSNIKSNLVLKIVFRHLKQRIKLLILKYNKNLKNKLNIQLKDYQEYNSLKAFNEQYKTKIKNTDVEKLIIVGRMFSPVIDNEGLKDLSKIEFIWFKSINSRENRGNEENG